MKNKLIIISPYPKKYTYSHRSSALASFNKNLVDKLKSKLDIVILSDNKNKKDNAIKIWSKNDFFNYFKLVRTINSYKNIQNILIQFEWGVFGKNIFFVMTFPFFLLVLKILGKKISVVLHGVNFDFQPIYGFGLKTNLLNIGSYSFYTFCLLLTNKIIVTEDYFKRKLNKLPFANNKIIFIPHGVDAIFNKQDKNNFEKLQLGYFGFLHPYKGPRLLLDLFNLVSHNNYSLSFLGGESPNLLKNQDYQIYLKNFYLTAKKRGIKITGFIEQNMLIKYFRDVDLVVFPYPCFISSSGMLAMTFSFEKPFILSRPLEGYFDSSDFQEALKETGLNKENFIFDFNKESLEKRLSWAKNNLDKLANFSRIMKEKRDWKTVAKQYEKLF